MESRSEVSSGIEVSSISGITLRLVSSTPVTWYRPHNRGASLDFSLLCVFKRSVTSSHNQSWDTGGFLTTVRSRRDVSRQHPDSWSCVGRTPFRWHQESESGPRMRSQKNGSTRLTKEKRVFQWSVGRLGTQFLGVVNPFQTTSSFILKSTSNEIKFWFFTRPPEVGGRHPGDE